MKVVIMLMLVALLGGCAVAPSAKNPFSKYSFEGVSYAPKANNFLVILDASSSMAETYKGQVKLNIAKDFLSTMNQSIPGIELKGALRCFGPNPFFCSGYKNLIYGLTDYTKDDFDKAQKKVVWATGDSPLSKAIEAGMGDLATAEGEIAVIIVTDGKDMGSAPVKAAKKMKKKFGSRLCIYTVLVGDDPAGEKMLKQMTKKDVCGFAVRADRLTTKKDMGKFVEDVFLIIGPDADRDRVFDLFDECPRTPMGVRVDDAGCPYDSDGDGIYDYIDKCPDTPKGIKVLDTGCPPDTDGDGVYDYKDKCPGTPKGAKVDAVGCWVLKGVKFDTGKAVIKTKYYPVLDKVAAILKKNPGIKVEIQGHTDSRGSEKYNQKLSKARAKMVMAYLVKAGIAQSRLAYAGYGESKPIAANNTSKGRAENRRVNMKRIR